MPRRAKSERLWRRRQIILALTAMLVVGGTILVGLERRGQAARQRRAERAGAERALAQAERERAAQVVREGLVRTLGRLQGPPARAGELLAALAKATPPAITLREVTCEDGNFIIRGHAYGAGGTSENPLLRFRRDLCPPEAPWQIPDPLPGPADFAWHGSFFPRPVAAAAAAALVAQVAAARAALRPAEAFDTWMRGWSRHWTCLARTAEMAPDLEVRHYALAYAQPRLGSWSDIVQTLQLLGAAPGVTVDSLALTAAPDGADAFTRARIGLTARLRRL